MGISIDKSRVPVEFQLQEEVKDGRFLKVKVFIAHVGENLNNSFFSKEVLEKFSKTLTHIPIVAYIEDNPNGKSDYSDHRSEITIKDDGEVDIQYKGHAYGFIPENHNAQFEYRGGKEWLTAEGYLWTKFKDSLDIFIDGNGIKGHSMEIVVTDGFVDDFGRVNYTDGNFSALCMLGDHVPAGMKGSTIEVFSNDNGFKREFSQMYEEFYSLSKEKGEVELPTIEELEKDTVEETKEVLEDTEFEDTTEEAKGEEVVESEAKEDEAAEDVDDKEFEEQEVEPEGEAAKESKDEVVEETEDKTTDEEANFELSHADIKNEIRKAVSEKMDDDNYYSIMDVYGSYAYVYTEKYSEEAENWVSEYYKVDYTNSGEGIELGGLTAVYPMFLTESEKTAIEDNRETIEDLKSQLSEYTEKEKEEKVQKYEHILGEDLANEIRAKFSEKTADEIETLVGFECFKLQADGEVKKDKVKAVDFSSEKGETPYGSLQRFFKK